MTKRQAQELYDRTADEEESDKDDDDDKAARDGSAKVQEEDAGPSRLLACPYYKRDREKFKSRRSCQRPGFPSVRRLKEHLYRRHTLGKFGCARCHEHFKEELHLEAHMRAQPPCETRPRDLLAGLDQAQYYQLLSRKRTRGVKTLEDKWKEVYKILFPDIEKEDIPSPYYDTDSVRGEGRPDDLEDRLRAFESSARRELPQYLRQLRDTGQHLGQRGHDDADLEGLSQALVRWTMERLRQSLPVARDHGHARSAESPVRSSGRDLPVPPSVGPQPAAQSSRDADRTAQASNATSYDPARMTEYSLVGIGGGFGAEDPLEALDPKLFVDFDETEGPGDADDLQF